MSDGGILCIGNNAMIYFLYENTKNNRKLEDEP